MKLGQRAFVGKVSMDIHNPWGYYEESVDKALDDAERFILYVMEELGKGLYYKKGLCLPVITPRFLPSCSEELLYGLGALAKKYQVPIQSHISESKDVMIM